MKAIEEYKATLQCVLKCLFYLPLYKNTKKATLPVFTVQERVEIYQDDLVNQQMLYIFFNNKTQKSTVQKCILHWVLLALYMHQIQQKGKVAKDYLTFDALV